MRRNNRKGSAAVELAITLPLMTTIVLGSVEICTQINTKQAIELAAYEAARVAARPGATNAQVKKRMKAILTQRRVEGAKISTSPASVEDVAKGTPITVTVTAKFSRNMVIPIRFVSDKRLEATCTMLKEL